MSDAQSSQTVETLALQLDPEARCSNRARHRWSCRCPAHDDMSPSLDIEPGNLTSIVFICRAGCSQEAILSAIRSRGIELGSSATLQKAIGTALGGRKPYEGVLTDAFNQILVPLDAEALSLPDGRRGIPSEIYDYRREDGRLVFRVARWDAGGGNVKSIMPAVFKNNAASKGCWQWGAPSAPRPLYGLDKLSQRPSATIIVVEGEKAVGAARKLFPDCAVITSSGGSSSVVKSDWTPLRDRDVVVWPDNDEPGMRYSHDVAQLAVKNGAGSVRIVSVPTDWPKGWDVADELPNGVSERDLQVMLDRAEPADKGLQGAGSTNVVTLDDPGDSRAVTRCLGDVTPIPIAWLWERRFALGKLNVLAGNPGLGKSQITAAFAACVTNPGQN